MNTRVILFGAALLISGILAAQNASAMVQDQGIMFLSGYAQEGACWDPQSNQYVSTVLWDNGYVDGEVDFGSYSPNILTGGVKVTGLFDFYDGCPVPPYVQIGFFSASGFSSDPGASWLGSITCGGSGKPTRYGSGANYSYSNGAAIWWWNNGPFNLPTTGEGTQVWCQIVHN